MKNKIWKIFHIFFLMLGIIAPAAFPGAIITANAFVAPADITIDGTFSDWGTIESPVSGVFFYQDVSNNGLQDGGGFAGKPGDLNCFWGAVSTQNGGTEQVSPSNLIQNIHYRIDTNSSTFTSGQSYFIQLNLGIAPPNYADHCLQIWADSAATPKVTIILYEFALPYPEIRAFTTGDMTALVSNVSGYGSVDTSAAGDIGLYDGSHYGVEVCTPVSWYGPDYGGNIEADGSGEPHIMGVVFTSTGSPGSVGTVKDTINDSNGYTIYYDIDTITGDIVFFPMVKLEFTSEEQTITAGEVSSVMAIQFQDRSGNPIDVSSDTIIELTSISAGGTFYSDASGTIQIGDVTIGSGTSSASFYYKDTLAGSPIITGAEYPDQGWTDAAQGETVTHAALDHFAFDNISDQTEDVTFSITITALDAYGNTVTSYTGSNILSDSNGTITPNSTGTFTTGVWTGEVTITSPDASVTITTSGGGRSGVSNPFAVMAVKLVLTMEGQTISAGEVSSVMTIQTQDGAGNPVDVGSDTIIELTSSSAGGTFYSDASGTIQIGDVTISAGTGSASFYYKDTLAGSPVITAAESPGQGWAGAAQGRTITHAALDHFAFDNIANQDEGMAFSITITALDAYGNIVTSYTGSNTLSDSKGTITPTATGTFTAGVWTGEVTITSPYTAVTITTSGGGREGVSNTFEVKAGDIKIEPGEIIHIRFEIINNTDETSIVSFQYQIPEELVIKSISVESYGLVSFPGNSINAVLGTLEAGNTAAVDFTVVVSRDVTAETSLAGLLKPDYLVLDIKPLEIADVTFSVSNLVIERCEEKYYSFVPFAKRSGERAEISMDVTGLESQQAGDHRINIIADDILLYTIDNTLDGDTIKVAGYDVELIVNGEVWETREVELGNGETEKVVFNLEKLGTGEYTVNISGLEAEFDSTLSVNWWLISTLLLTVVFIGYLVTIYVLP